MANNNRTVEKIDSPIVGEYKAHPILSLPVNVGEDGFGYPFSFGLAKAKAILDNIEDIERFVENAD
jgi:hypothetical protein